MSFTKKSGDVLKYLDEARKKYGPKVDKTAAKVQSWSTETYEQTKAEGEQILSELSEMVKNTPDDPRVQALVKRYHEHLNTFNKMSKDMFGKVSDLYTDDKRFAAYYKRFHKNMPEFLQQAIKTYTGAKKAKSSKKK